MVIALFQPGAQFALAQSNANANPAQNETTPTASAAPAVKNPKGYKNEITSLRTPFTSTYLNNDGTKTLTYALDQQNYLDNKNSWQKIDNSLSSDIKALGQSSLLQGAADTDAQTSTAVEFNGQAGAIESSMKSLSSGVTISLDGKTVTMKPKGAANVAPEKLDDQSVIYKDAYKNIDLIYELRGESVKEIIVLKDRSVQSTFDFNVSGGKVLTHPTKKGELTIEGMPNDFSFSSLTLDLNDSGIMTNPPLTQTATNTGIKVVLDQKWLVSQPSSSFPMRIYPSFARDATSYWMYKSDGYKCNASNCYANIGTIKDAGQWKKWRTYAQFPYKELAGKKVVSASMRGYFKYGTNGMLEARDIWMGHANCNGYNCKGTQIAKHASVGADFKMDLTKELQATVNRKDYGAIWSFWGEKGNYKSFKPYYNLKASIVYENVVVPPKPTPVAPAQDVLGELSYQQYDSQAISSKFGVKVNVSNGNVIAQTSDMNIKSVGPAL